MSDAEAVGDQVDWGSIASKRGDLAPSEPPGVVCCRRDRRFRQAVQVTWLAGGSAQPDRVPGSVAQSAIRQNGVTAW